MGVDVVGKTKEALNKIPFLEERVTTDLEALHERQLSEKNEELNMLQQQVEGLEAEVESKEQTITDLEEEVAGLTKEMKESEEEATEEPDEKWKEVATSYSEMKPKKCCLYFRKKWKKNIVISILKQVDAEVRGEILAAMDPEIAASFTESFLVE